jgi:threonine dehydrogenase-like Zn-dependent dehydrogenase
VPAPELPSDQGALVRPLVVSTCDMDGVVISGAARFKGPVPVGHEGVAEVVEVGEKVRSLSPGDRVIVPWKISCGTCAKCQAGLTAHCLSVVPEAAYGWGPTAREWGGFLADLVAVPWADHMLHRLPASIHPIAASGLADNITDAWRAVGPPLRQRPGGSVLVAGGGGPGSIGLFSVGLARSLGAGEITYLDWDEGRRGIAAERYEATVIDTSAGLPADELSGSFDVIVDASGNPEALTLVLKRTASGAIVTSTAAALYAFGDIPFPVLSMYRRGVSFHTGWVNTRALMHEPLALIADGSFDPRVVETAVIGFDQAEEALAEPFTKLAMVADQG